MDGRILVLFRGRCEPRVHRIGTFGPSFLQLPLCGQRAFRTCARPLQMQLLRTMTLQEDEGDACLTSQRFRAPWHAALLIANQAIP
jgi:hypothetical protein